MSSLVAAGVAILVSSAILTPIALAQARRWSRAQTDPIGDACIACGGATLVEQHPDAWRCTDCDYEQGPGWQRMRDEAHLASLMALSPEDAAAHARGLLDDAHLALLGAIGPLANPVSVEQHGRHQSYVVNPELLDASHAIDQSWRWLHEAALIDATVKEALEVIGFDDTSAPPATDPLHDDNPHKVAAHAARIHAQVAQAAERVGAAKAQLTG